jgi:hypothetical protein
MDYCETTPLAGRKKRFRVRAGAGDGWGFGLAPDARYDLTVSETGNGTSVSGFATDYPNVEIWEYSDGASPKQIFGTQTSWGPFGGPLSLLPPNPMVPIPPE